MKKKITPKEKGIFVLFCFVLFCFVLFCFEELDHGPIKAKLTCKGTLRQVFIRDYRLEIQSVMLVFLTRFCELFPLQPSVWFNSSYLPSLPFVNK
jgi:hypothetical protein